MKIEPFIEPDEIEKAYAAGFLDGEGCFGVVHYQSRKLMADGSERAPGCRVQVYVGQDNKAPLEFLAYRWGGTLHENIEPTGHKFYRLNFARAVAVKLCEDLLPYLIVKRSSAQHLLLAADTVISKSRNRRTPEQIEAQQAAVVESRRLNSRKE